METHFFVKPLSRADQARRLFNHPLFSAVLNDAQFRPEFSYNATRNEWHEPHLGTFVVLSEDQLREYEQYFTDHELESVMRSIKRYTSAFATDDRNDNEVTSIVQKERLDPAIYETYFIS